MTTDRWVKCISTQGNIRGVAVQATGLIQQMASLHQQTGTTAQGLGEAVMGALLLASNSKVGERVNLNVRGSGIVQQALIDAYPDGKVRGYVAGSSAEPVMTLLTDESTTGVGPWGTGLLSVLRTKAEDFQKPYIGTVPLLTGHLAKDLTFYWVQSEQIPSAMGLAVNLQDGKVMEAGGFLVQALPGASPDEVASIERHIHSLQSLASELARNGDPVHLLSRIFESTAFMILEERALEFSCNCSRDRALKALALIGAPELQSLLEEEGKASVHCDFCVKDYLFEKKELEAMILAART